MNQLDDLYQEVIFDHNKSPRNFGPLENADHEAKGFNPLCGDKINVYIEMDGEIIKDIHFDGSGCAISKASASIMTTLLLGKNKTEARELFEKFRTLITVEHDYDEATLGKLVVFAGVREFPTRVKCATLAWHTMQSAINNDGETVTTEKNE